jgi:hypothetical protein
VDVTGKTVLATLSGGNIDAAVLMDILRETGDLAG